MNSNSKPNSSAIQSSSAPGTLVSFYSHPPQTLIVRFSWLLAELEIVCLGYFVIIGKIRDRFAR